MIGGEKADCIHALPQKKVFLSKTQMMFSGKLIKTSGGFSGGLLGVDG